MNAIQFIKEHGVDAARIAIGCADMGEIDTQNTNDLKRLVASVDLVKSFGGIANAQEDELWANELGFGYKGLKQAIADYEAIFGESE